MLLTESDRLLRAVEGGRSSRRRWRRLAPLMALRVLGDALAVLGGALIAYQYRFYVSGVPIPGGGVPQFAPYLEAAPVVAAIWLLTFAFTGRYRFSRGQSFLDEILGSVGSVALFVVVTVALEGLYRGFPYSRLVLADGVVVAVCFFILERALIRAAQAALLRRGAGAIRVLVVGSGSVADLLLGRLRMFPEFGYRVVGRVRSSAEAVSADPSLPEYPLQTALAPVIQRERVDTVLLALSGVAHDEVLRLAGDCLRAGADVKVVPDVLEIMSSAASPEQLAGIPLVGLRPSRLVGVNLGLKRAFDLVLTALLAVPALPVVAVCALAVVLGSPGSPFYCQERLGQDGSVFRIWKLRSMRSGADRGPGGARTIQGDERRTPVGRVLRRFSLDELPQLWNVLLGEMSLVGPRPLSVRESESRQYELLVPRYRERLSAPPGCTGWAQVNDLRQASSIEERVFYDLYYIENWSLALDFKILLLTPWRLLFHRHAF